MSGRSRNGIGLLANLLLLVVAVVSTVAIVELASRAYARRNRPDVGFSPAEQTAIVDQVPDYGYALPANRALHVVKHNPDGSVCYDVTYRTDAFGRRTLGQSYDPSHPHLILFGCSVTMGEGLDDADTLAAQLSGRLPGYNVYNYGVHGYGPQHTLAKLQAGTVPSEVVSGRGIAVYSLLPVHISRAIGDSRAFWIYGSPYYRLDGDATLRREGSFETGRPYMTALYRNFAELRAHSWFLSLVDVGLPFRLSDSDADLTARILEQARAEYRAQFTGEFYVVFHPTWARRYPEIAHLLDVMRRHLVSAGVPVLDYSTDAGLTAEEQIDHGCDPHPDGRLNAELAQRLARDVGGVP